MSRAAIARAALSSFCARDDPRNVVGERWAQGKTEVDGALACEIHHSTRLGGEEGLTQSHIITRRRVPRPRLVRRLAYTRTADRHTYSSGFDTVEYEVRHDDDGDDDAVAPDAMSVGAHR